MTSPDDRLIPVKDFNGNPAYLRRKNLLEICVNYEISASAAQINTGEPLYEFENGDKLLFCLIEVGTPALKNMSDAELSFYWARARHDYLNLYKEDMLLIEYGIHFTPIPKDIAEQVMEDIEVERLKQELALEQPEIFTLKDNDTEDAPEVRAELHKYDHCVELILRAEEQPDDEARIVRLEMDDTQLRVMCANQSKEAGIVVEIPELGEMDVQTAAYYQAPFVDDPEPGGP
ncbi:hypothetical protein [Sulfitobacter sp. R18_1]|uniref:hypothetical protein n=1 Tax=Sulfitobacter sp. R18_1 TaxID=2821104 RepID=UPI001ADAC20A|nr:hypothetical protein [Sulfitobacter sp. R18_1]MBO9428092.1 hypothetical protein [Sulfitobacter sp. R18_1]